MPIQQYNFLQRKAMDYPRTAGIITIAVGTFFFYDGFFEPYLQVKSYVAEVIFSLSETIIGIPIILIGVIFLAFGNRFSDAIFLPINERSRKQRYIFNVIILTATLVALFALEKWLEVNGYSFF